MSETDNWDHHWREYEQSAARNPAQDFRRKLTMRLLDRREAPTRIVDVGSGTGELMVALRDEFPGAELVGIELSLAGIEIARRKVPDAVFLQRDLTQPEPLPPERADWATHAVCSEVLEHVDDPRGLLEASRSYLAPGCCLVVTVPGGPMTAYDRHIGHRRHFRPADLAEVLRAAGFDVVRATGAGFPVFNLYRLLMRAPGSRLIGVAGAGEPSPLVRVATGAFAFLLGFNTRLSHRGWQVVAIARVPQLEERARG